MAVVKSKMGKFGLFLANPMLAKLNKIEDNGEPSIGKKGVISKTLILLLLVVAGVVLYFVTHGLVSAEYVQTIEGYDVNVMEAGITIIAIIIAALGTWLSYKFVRGAVVFGSFYSLTEGYALAFVFHLLGKDFLFPGLIALGVTIILILVMLMLYRAKLIKVEKKFVSILLTLIISGIIFSLCTFILSLIPATEVYANYIIENSGIVMVCGILGIVIATLFLLVDFSIIDECIEKQLPKKYEWLASFALSFSIIELYLKIFNFILQVTNNNSN